MQGGFVVVEVGFGEARLDVVIQRRQAGRDLPTGFMVKRPIQVSEDRAGLTDRLALAGLVAPCHAHLCQADALARTGEKQ